MRRFLALTLLSLLLVAQAVLAEAGDSAEKHPAGAFDHYSKGRALAEQGNYKGAIAEYEAAIKLDPKYDYAYGSLGYAYYELGDFDAAAKAYEAAIKISPNDPFYWSELGMSYTKLKNVGKGIPALEMAIKLAPDDEAATRLIMGKLYEDTGDNAKAAKEYQRCLDLKPSDPRLVQAAQVALQRVQK